MKTQCSAVELLLGDARLDDGHRAFYEKLNRAVATSGEQFALVARLADAEIPSQ